MCVCVCVCVCVYCLCVSVCVCVCFVNVCICVCKFIIQLKQAAMVCNENLRIKSVCLLACSSLWRGGRGTRVLSVHIDRLDSGPSFQGTKAEMKLKQPRYISVY